MTTAGFGLPEAGEAVTVGVATAAETVAVRVTEFFTKTGLALLVTVVTDGIWVASSVPLTGAACA